MKKIISAFLTLTIASVMAISTAFADYQCPDGFDEKRWASMTEDEQAQYLENPKPPVVVDENFDIDKQDFLDNDTVTQVKLFLPEQNNREITFKSGKPFLDDDTRMRIPLRDFAEQMGYEVKWYPETGQIILSNAEEWYTITPQDNIVVCKPHMVGHYLVGHFVMDCSPEIIDGVTYIPIRHIANILYHNVVWDEATKTANLYNASVISVDKGVVYVDFTYAEIPMDIIEE